MEQQATIEEIDHTGDAGFHVEAPDLGALFSTAAFGMLDMIADIDEVQASTDVRITLAATNLSTLLYRFLSEINHRHLVDALVFCRATIRKIDEKSISATLHGESYDPEKHTIHTEIKAVTLHQLEVKKCENKWCATVIFDL